MKILLVCATRLEIEFINEEMGKPLQGVDLEILVSGVGPVHTSFALQRQLSRGKPDLVIGAGVAGCFSIEQSLGQVFKIRSEVFADLGVQESRGWTNIFDLGLADENAFPYQKGRLVNPNDWPEIDLPVADACTVNEITTHREKIDRIVKNYGAQIESMEGAALHYVCLMENVPFIHLRAVSNIVGERDKQRWRMQQAVRNLGEEIINCIKRLSVSQQNSTGS